MNNDLRRQRFLVAALSVVTCHLDRASRSTGERENIDIVERVLLTTSVGYRTETIRI